MRIALAQINFTIADIPGNSKKIVEAILKAKSNGADLVVFSELSISAYMPDDLLDYPHFIQECENAINEIAKHCFGICAIVGAPMKNEANNGRKLYNTACVLENGKIVKQIHKTLLPTYDIFNESRYFEVNDAFETVTIAGKKLAVTICEDLWNSMDRFNYKTNPILEFAGSKPDIIINISASPFHLKKKKERLNVLQKQAIYLKTPLVYVNQTGVHSDLIFDGDSMVLNENGEVLIELPLFQDDFTIYNTEFDLPELISKSPDEIEILYRALVYGIQNFFNKTGFTKAVIGSSGGIDSAVVQALATAAIGKDNVSAILMPSQFSSAGSINDAQLLSENLGNAYYLIPIHDVCTAFDHTLKPIFNKLPFDIAEENIQSRTRAVLLMAVSNKFGDILLNTSNKSEMAVGYTTLYGDMCGSLSVIGDVYKTSVYALAEFINREKNIIPSEIIKKAPSAELRHEQKDIDSLPEYDILDGILKLYIEGKKSSIDIIKLGYEKDVVEKTIRMVNQNEFKRFQAPPILRVSEKAFGRGRIIPLVSKW